MSIISGPAGRRILRSAAGLACSALVSTPVFAHVGTGLPGGFLAGFKHPFSGLDHLLAMVSVGLWGAFLGRPLLYVLPVIFPIMMVGGALLGMFGLPLPRVDLGIALSVLVLGSCIALSLRAPIGAACILVAAFAIFHGYAHGKELPSAADPVGYSEGFVLATGLLHLSGIGLGLLVAVPHGTLALRCAGALIAILGVGFVLQALGA